MPRPTGPYQPNRAPALLDAAAIPLPLIYTTQTRPPCQIITIETTAGVAAIEEIATIEITTGAAAVAPGLDQDLVHDLHQAIDIIPAVVAAFHLRG